MATSNETWQGVLLPAVDDLLMTREVADGKVLSGLTQEEKNERIFAFWGKRILRSTIINRHPLEEPTQADWECLHVERPELYEAIAQTAVEAMLAHGLTPPSFADRANELATVHDIEELRSRRQAEGQQEEYALQASGPA